MFINRYAFWDPTTWQIPKLYWDAFSDEQRIHAICKQLGKVIAYADYVGVNVDDIASRLKAIEEGQLDPYIVAKIEEWFTENQPAIMQTLAAHTQEIQLLSDEIDLIGANGWVTTNRIADGAVTAAKLDESIPSAISDNTERIEDIETNLDTIRATKYLGKSIAPVYVGDFMADLQHGCCVRVADLVYSFMSDSYSDTNSMVIVNNLATNSRAWTKQVALGHANSCAWDERRQCFWIAPHYLYSNGNQVATNNVYMYDPLFNARVDVNIGSQVYALSCDSVTGRVYAMTNAHDSVIKILALEPGAATNQWTLYTTINANDITRTGNTTVLQDFAVHDDVMYLVRNEGTGYILDMKNGDDVINPLQVNDVFTIEAVLSQNTFELGEVEGIEFGDDGILYNARNSLYGITGDGNHYQLNNAFVTALNVAGKAYPTNYYNQTVYNTLTLSADTQAEFCLGRSHIRSLNQLNHIKMSYSRVNIDGTVNEYHYVRLINTSVTVWVNGRYNVDRFILNGGTFGMYIVSGATLHLRSTTSDRAMDVTNANTVIFIRNAGTISMPANITSFIINSYMSNLIFLQQLNSPSTLTIGTTARGTGVYYGNAGVLTS